LGVVGSSFLLLGGIHEFGHGPYLQALCGDVHQMGLFFAYLFLTPAFYPTPQISFSSIAHHAANG